MSEFEERRPWLLLASIAALLVGIGSVAGGLLFGSIPDAQEFPRESVEAPRESVEVPVNSGGIVLSERTNPAKVSVDDEWVARTAERTGISERAVSAYALAAARMSVDTPGCGLGWNTLAGIGFVESEHGTMHGASLGADGRAEPEIIGVPLDGTTTARIPDTDGGRLDGDAVWDRAVGPMQFIPSTWARWASDGNGDGVRDPHSIDDAAYSAARYLCADGRNLGDAAQWIDAVAAYNDSVEYNNRVAEAADHYAGLAQ